MTTTSTEVERLFSAIESRDLRLLRDACVPEVSWRNVPESPVVGVDAVCSLIGTVTLPAEEVRWEIERLSVSDGRAHVERLDRFRIFGEWHEVWCHGVLSFAPRIGPVRGRVAARDSASVFADLSSRSGSALERLGAILSPDVVLDVRSAGAMVRHSGWCAVVDELEQGWLDIGALVGGVGGAEAKSDMDGWRVEAPTIDGRVSGARWSVVAGRVGACSIRVR
ncbi:MAG: hypothetical protein ACO3NX_06130 [Ilumatobacteraceae bacterium]